MLGNDELDALTEIVNIGVGRAGSALSELIGDRIELRVPVIQVVSPEFVESNSESGLAIVQGFQGEINGNALLVFPIESGKTLATILGGFESSAEISEIEMSGILSEVGNIVLNGVLGSLANAIADNLVYAVPEFFVDESMISLMQRRSDEMVPGRDSVVLADTKFGVQAYDISGSILLAFRLSSIENLCHHLQLLQV